MHTVQTIRTETAAWSDSWKPGTTMNTRIASDSSKMMSNLPPELIRSLSTQLGWSDVLSMRNTCSNWGHGLAPLVKQLRIPLVPAPRTGCRNNFYPAAPQLQPAEQLTTALAQLEWVTSVTLLLTEATKPLDLQQALQIIGSKKNITKLVLYEMEGSWSSARPRRYAPALQLSELVHVEDLKIRTLSWSLEDIWKQVAALGGHPINTCGGDATAPEAPDATSINRDQRPSPRPYALRQLTIEQAPESKYSSMPHEWRLTKLTCDLGDLTLPSQLTHLSTPLPGQYNQAGEVVGPLNAAHETYVSQLAAGLPDLLSLVINNGVYEGKEKVFEDFGKLQELHCQPSIALSPADDPYLDTLDNEDESPTLLLASRVGALQRLELLPTRRQGPDLLHGQLPCWRRQELAPPGRRFKLSWLQHNTELEHLAAKLVASGEDLPGLSAVDGQLRSLTGRAPALPSEALLYEVWAVGSGLTSLELFIKGPDLSSRSRWAKILGQFIRMAQVPTPVRPLGNLQSLTLVAERRNFYVVPDPAAFWAALPAIHSLRLQNVGLGYSADGDLSADRVVTVMGNKPGEQVSAKITIEDRLVLWLKDLPCSRLQQLELSQYAIVAFEPPVKAQAASNTTGSTSGSVKGGAEAADGLDGSQPQQQRGQENAEGEAVHGEAVVTGAEGARLARLSLQDEDQQSEAPTDANSSSNTGTFCQDCDLSRLHHLALVDCSCLVVTLLPDSDSNADAGPQPKAAGRTTMQPLLARLTGPAASAKLSGSCSGSLRTLWLDDVVMCLSTIQYICSSPLGKQLQELHVFTQGWQGDTDPAAGAPGSQQPHPDSEGIAAALTAAVAAGNLLELRHLSLHLSVLGGGPGGANLMVPGLSALTACTRLPSLQELHMRVCAGANGGGEGERSEWCDCTVPVRLPSGRTSSNLTRMMSEGPWWDLLQLQHLRVLEVMVISLESSRPPPARQGRAAQGPEEKHLVVGGCSKCGGAVSEVGLLDVMRCAAAGRLAGCNMKVAAYPSAQEEWEAINGPPQQQAMPAGGAN